MNYSVILECDNKPKGFLIILKRFFKRYLSFPFKNLKTVSIFKYQVIFEDIFYRFSNKYRVLISGVQEYDFSNAEDVFIVESIDSLRVQEIIKDGQYAVGILGGVGILKSNIIDLFSMFCLNSHPAPLPECPGGGALEYTLALGLLPACSIHVVTEKVDSGDIVDVRKLALSSEDSFFHVRERLNFLCGQVMADVVLELVNGRSLGFSKNDGKMRLWRHCSHEIQVLAHRNFSKIKKEIKDDKG